MDPLLLPDNKFFGLLRDCQHTLRWLKEAEPVASAEIPPGHQENIKRLEKVGICYRRNNSIGLRKQRLRRVAEQFSLAMADVNSLDANTVARQMGLDFLVVH